MGGREADNDSPEAAVPVTDRAVFVEAFESKDGPANGSTATISGQTSGS